MTFSSTAGAPPTFRPREAWAGGERHAAMLPRENGPALWHEIERAANARLDDRSGHIDWAFLAEEAGLLNLAFRELQLALRDDPNDADAAFRLAHHYRERGDTARAATLLERFSGANPAREDWLRLYIDILTDDGAQPKIRAAIDRAIKADLLGLILLRPHPNQSKAAIRAPYSKSRSPGRMSLLHLPAA